jgi:predicted Zn finger-like uncharacterized protein
MRLTCPNCGVEYEVPEAAVAPAGRHVQCTACHTRWFARAAAPVSEEQILSRLEAWSPRPRLVPVPDPEPAPEPGNEAGNFLWEQPDAEGAAEPPRAQPAPTPLARPAGPVKPAHRPTVPRPAAVADSVPPARPAPRLDLDAGPVPAAAAPRRRSRFGRGLLLVLALAALALGAYRFRDDLAARAPEAAPALRAYGAWVDGVREEIEERIAPLRPAQAPAAR